MTDDLETALNSPGVMLWRAYCEKKMDLEGAEEKIELLKSALKDVRSMLESVRNGTTEYNMLDVFKAIDNALVRADLPFLEDGEHHVVIVEEEGNE